jgi:hypothetical protein
LPITTTVGLEKSTSRWLFAPRTTVANVIQRVRQRGHGNRQMEDGPRGSSKGLGVEGVN